MQDGKAQSSMSSAFALMSVMFLVVAMSGASMIRAESPAGQAHSFIGTAPDAATIEVSAPTF